MSWRDVIHSDPAIMMGKPVIRGTRITVELILDLLGAGDSIDDVLLAYPNLTREHVLAALKCASRRFRVDWKREYRTRSSRPQAAKSA